MWRTAVLVIAVTLLDYASADDQLIEGRLIQRLRRSPQFCDDGQNFVLPPLLPPPPIPGPPPPPPHHFPPPPPPILLRQEQPSNYITPCNTCGGTASAASAAFSNAQSGTGDAVAVAVANGK